MNLTDDGWNNHPTVGALWLMSLMLRFFCGGTLYFRGLCSNHVTPAFLLLSHHWSCFQMFLFSTFLRPVFIHLTAEQLFLILDRYLSQFLIISSGIFTYKYKMKTCRIQTQPEVESQQGPRTPARGPKLVLVFCLFDRNHQHAQAFKPFSRPWIQWV